MVVMMRRGREEGGKGEGGDDENEGNVNGEAKG